MSHQSHASSLAWWALPPLMLQCIALNWSAPLTWPTWALVLCALFKLRECRRPFDRRLVALLQLVSTGLLAAQLQGLLASLLQVLAVLLALAGLLGHEMAGVLSFQGFLQRSLQLLTAALPLALVLFLFVPRLPPLWTTQLGTNRNSSSANGKAAASNCRLRCKKPRKVRAPASSWPSKPARASSTDTN